MVRFVAAGSTSMPGDEATIDLHAVDRQFEQVREARVAGAEVVDRHVGAGTAQLLHVGQRDRTGREQVGLGDLDDHLRRIGAGLLAPIEERVAERR